MERTMVCHCSIGLEFDIFVFSLHDQNSPACGSLINNKVKSFEVFEKAYLTCGTHLSKSPSNLKPNGMHEKHNFLAHAPFHFVVYFVVPSVSF